MKRIAFVWLAALSLVATAGAQDDAALDELLNLPPQRPVEPPRDAEGGEADGPLQRDMDRLLNEGTPADELEVALRQMEDVAFRLAERFDPGLDTQREQESILRKLDQVIAAAAQQESSSSSSSSSSGGSQQARQQDVGGNSVAQQQQQQGNPNRPGEQQGQDDQAGANENRGETGTGGRPPGEARDQPLAELRKEWGNLPPRLRDELTEGLSEEFSPAYRELTEQYYRALAEEE